MTIFPAQFHDATHNRYCRGRYIFTDNGLPRRFKRRHDGTLVRRRALFDKGERRFRILAAFHKALGNEIHVGDAHQEDEGAGTMRKSVKVERKIASRDCVTLAGFAMTSPYYLTTSAILTIQHDANGVCTADNLEPGAVIQNFGSAGFSIIPFITF